MIRALLIDIDNTILDFDAYVREAMKTGFAKFGIGEYREEMFPIFTRINLSLWRRIEQGTLTFEELQKIRWNRVFEGLGFTFDGPTFERYFRSMLNENAIPVEGAHETLAYLQTKYVLGAASNAPYRQQVGRLQLAGMKRYFRHFFLSERIGASKPDPAFFDACMCGLREEMPDLQPDEVMMIGDSLTSDVGGGQAYGMQCCYFDREGKHNAPPGCPSVTKLEQLRELL